jgi:hypothetical protein
VWRDGAWADPMGSKLLGWHNDAIVEWIMYYDLGVEMDTDLNASSWAEPV